MRKLVVIVALGLVVASCGRVAQKVTENVAEKVAEKTAEQAAGDSGDANVDINQDEGTVNIQVEEDGKKGSLTIGGNEVPADFPIPLPDGGEVIAVIDTTQDGKRATTVSLTYPADRWDELVAFFQDWADGLPGDTQVTVTTGSIQSASFFNDEAEVGVGLTVTGDVINVVATSGDV